jgi:HD-like signal output (HDOD) protein
MALSTEVQAKLRAVPPKAHPAWRVDPDEVPLTPGERRDGLRKAIADLVRSDRFELPPLPAVAQEVFLASGRPQTPVKELARIVHRDAFIAGRVLRVANSAHYGFARAADNLHGAIVRIGVDELRNIVVALGLKGEVFRARGFEKEAEVTWRHSLASAIAAGMLATASKRVERHRAFLAGLLHNVGCGVVLKAAVELCKQRPQESDEVRRNVRPVMMSLFRETGGLVSRRWKLDEGLHEAIVFCDDPAPSGVEPELTRHVTLGRAAAFQVGLGPWEPADQYSIHPLRAQLERPPDFDERFLAQLPQKYEAYESAT